MKPFVEEQMNLQSNTNQFGISWTGQAGFAFKDSTNLIYHIDPYLSNACSRTVGYHRIIPPPVEAHDVKTDFILLTHEHKDHLDPDSIPIISKMNPNAKFVGPPSCISILLEIGVSTENLITIRRGESKKVGTITVEAVKAFHTDDSVGYVFNFNGTKVYLTGDTTYSDELISISEAKPDLMLTCINGRLGCMNIPDAARLTAHIQPKFVVPMHIGMFKENTANPEEFIRQAQSYSGLVTGYMMEHGKWYLFDRKLGFIYEEKESESLVWEV